MQRDLLLRYLLAPAAGGALAVAAPAADQSGERSADPPADAPAIVVEAGPDGADEATRVPPGAIPASFARAQAARSGDDLPPLTSAASGYEKVVSTADGAQSLYTLWKREKDGQLLAELPRNFGTQQLFIAFTVAGGDIESGVQTGDVYAYWKRFDKRLALIEPNYAVRTTGDLESKKGHDRVFTDRVILDVPIVANGEAGGPVIDLDALLLGGSTKFFGFRTAGAQAHLATIAKAKAFPQNIEVAFEVPLADGRFRTLHYSISALPKSTGYKSRTADNRVGYFTTSHQDIGHPSRDTPWVRDITRWKVQKADPRLRLSPPREPIVFYLEHTVPVRYRRWVREGVLEWNKAFEKVGIVGAIEVYQQDARTGAHMEKDPEDARYNFLLWTNSNMGFAIGPSRVDPRTGQILDADIVMDEGFVTSWWTQWSKLAAEAAMTNFGPETRAWLAANPDWDPRVRLAAPSDRDAVARNIAHEHAASAVAHPAAVTDPTLLGDDAFDGLVDRLSQVNGRCDFARMTAMELALVRLDPALVLHAGQDSDDPPAGEDDDEGAEGEGDDEPDDESAEDTDADESGAEPMVADDEQKLDGVPESFIGPLLKAVIMHEVGHTLGLRHNFKASSVYGLDEINDLAHRGEPITGSVMDYAPVNIGYQAGTTQGEYAMVTLGPYDYWAIEYGYTTDSDLEKVLERVSEPELAYLTDEDSWGSDPLARVFDLGANPLDYADSQMALVAHLRERILEDMVKDGESWAKAREAYELLLSRHTSAVSIAANWLGGVHAVRDHKGDPGDRDPVTPVSVEQQRRALAFVLKHTFHEDAYGLSPELLRRMTVDKWFDGGGMASIFADRPWPIHDRILGVQAAALTMLLNPTTLARVHDNEFRIPADEDALTLPEMLDAITAEAWAELDAPVAGFTNRRPMISSLRRNLQREHIERLIDLTLPNPGFGVAEKPIRTLAMAQLRALDGKMDTVLRRRSALDQYTHAHLSEAKLRIGKALDASYIYNQASGGGGASPFMIFGAAPGN